MFRKFRKSAAALICFLLAISAVMPAYAKGNAKQISDYRCWAQDDPRWANVELGNSGLTIEDAGCAVVSFTKLLIQAGIKDDSFTPDQLVSWMKKNDQFCTTKGKRAQIASWKGMASISSELSFVNTKSKPSAADLMNAVSKGYYIILNVTLKNGGTHFVVVANDASSKAGKPVIWNSVKGVSASKDLWESYNLNKDPYNAFKAVKTAIMYQTASSEPVQETPEAQEPTSAMELKNDILPSGILAKGSAFTVSGIVASDMNIEYLALVVMNEDGETMFMSDARAVDKTFSLYNLDSELTFSKLPEGSYTWMLMADNGLLCDCWDGSFSVKSSDIKTSGITCPSGTLTKGKTFSCKGTVSSSNKIQKVTMSVYSVDGVKQFEASAEPGTKSYDLHKLDAQMTFRKLGAGKYIYRVTVVDANGVASNVVTKSFSVK